MTERDWDGAPYVRVYQTIRDDPKFDTVRDDDRALAAWLRLLMDAEPVFPAHASLPSHLSRYARNVLVRAGILIITGRTFTLSGLAKERAARESRFTGGAGRRKYPSDVGLRHSSESVASSIPTPDLARAGASSSSSYSVDSSESPPAPAREAQPFLDAIAFIEERTRRPWVFGPGSKVWDALEPDVRDFGWPAVKVAMEAEKAPFPDAAQLVFGAARRLHPISGPEKQADPDPEYVKRAVAAQRKAKNGA